ncbi:MAG TPA: hypothetical protein VGP17_12975 [Solirubrobacteraceae bacterium]|jgi:hypothetical protein|nr:hypothetical protein [Solirubrobacteraceae bacterium]
MAADDGSARAKDAPGVDQAPRGMGAARRIGEQEERFGPLALARYLKDDGRALLLYRHIGGQRP